MSQHYRTKENMSIYKNHFLSSFFSSLIISSFIILVLHMYHYLSNVIFLMYMCCKHSWFLCIHCILLSLYHHGLREINKLIDWLIDLLSKLGEISFQEYFSEGISHPIFDGDLVVNKLRRVKCEANFVSSGS